MLEVGGRDQDRIDILQRQQVIHVLERAGHAPYACFGPGGRLLAVDLPEVADGRHLRGSGFSLPTWRPSGRPGRDLQKKI